MYYDIWRGASVNRASAMEVRVWMKCKIIRVGPCASKNAHQLSFFRVVDVSSTHPQDLRTPPYIVAPSRLCTGLVSNALSISVTVCATVDNISTTTQTCEYVRPTQMSKLCAVILRLRNSDVSCIGASIRTTLTNLANANKLRNGVPTANRAKNNTKPTEERNDEDEDEEDEDDDDEEDEEKDFIHVHYRDTKHSPRLFGEHASACYSLEHMLRETKCDKGVALPLFVDNMKSDDDSGANAPAQQSPAWRVQQVHGADLITGRHLNKHKLAVPLSKVLKSDALNIAYTLIRFDSHEPLLKKLLANAHAASGTTKSLSISHIRSMCNYAASVPKHTAALMGFVKEIATAVGLCARGRSYVSMCAYQPASVLCMLSTAQLRVLAHAIRSGSITAILPSELAVQYEDVCYFSQLAIQRLAYGRYSNHTFLEDDQTWGATRATRVLSNIARFGGGDTVCEASVDASENLPDQDHGTVVTAFDNDQFALGSEAFYCRSILDALEAFEDGAVGVITYFDVDATARRLAKDIRSAKSTGAGEVIMGTNVLVLTHSEGLASHVRKFITAQVFACTSLCALETKTRAQGIVRKFDEVVVFRADQFSSMMLHRALTWIDPQACTLTFMHNPNVLPSRRFFGVGAPMHSIMEAGRVPTVADWRASSALHAMASVLYKPASLASEADSVKRMITHDLAVVRSFIEANGRDVQLFTLGTPATQLGAKSLGHSSQHTHVLDGVVRWCAMYAPLMALSQCTRSHSAPSHRIYVEDTGHLAYVKGAYSVDFFGATHRNLTGIVDTTNNGTVLVLEPNTANRVYMTDPRFGHGGTPPANTMVPCMHQVVDGVCLPSEDYAGAPVAAGVVYITGRVTHRALASVSAMITENILFVLTKSHPSNVEKLMRVISRRTPLGRIPRTPIAALLREMNDIS